MKQVWVADNEDGELAPYERTPDTTYRTGDVVAIRNGSAIVMDRSRENDPFVMGNDYLLDEEQKVWHTPTCSHFGHTGALTWMSTKESVLEEFGYTSCTSLLSPHFDYTPVSREVLKGNTASSFTGTITAVESGRLVVTLEETGSMVEVPIKWQSGLKPGMKVHVENNGTPSMSLSVVG